MCCPSCHNQNPGEARFCMHCGGSLAGAPPAPTPQTYTPPHLANKILTMRSALEGERKQVSVLFADVKGSVELSEQVDAEQWHRVLDRFFQILARGIHRFEGTVNQFTGDGIMALFGAPIAHEDHAQRACFAALHLQRALEGYADEVRRVHGLNFRVRMGLNSGEVVVGKIGDDLRMDYTAQGLRVGLAARVQELAAADRIYLAPDTARLVEGYFELEDLGGFDLKGIGSVTLHELIGPGELRSRLDLSRARGFSAFLGREDEMRTLEGALDAALEGRAQLVAFVGEAGVGKSRLCYEFLERCRARGIPCTQTRGVSHGRTISLLPILDLYREALGVREHETPRESRERIAGRVLLLDDSLAESLPLMFDFLGVPDPDRPAPKLSPEIRQKRLVDFDVRYSIARSHHEPMVTLYEDLHVFDEASLGWLTSLMERAVDTRTLIIVNFRPEFVPDWEVEIARTPLRIEPLAEETAVELLDSLLGDDAGLRALKQRIHSATEGNPFFIEEVVRSLVEARQLAGEPGAYRLLGRLPDIEIPDTVQSLLAARIDQLPEWEKSVLQVAAVIAGKIPRALLEAVVGEGAGDLDATLAELLERELLREVAIFPEPVYRFFHPLTREVAYQSQLDSRRARTHERVARALESVDPEHLDERAALIAHHWERAGQGLAAARWHHRAALWTSVQDLAEALRHWRKARELLLPLESHSDFSREDMELGILVRLGLLEVGARHGLSRAEAAQLMREGRELAERAGDRPRQCLVLVAYGCCCIFGAELEEGLAVLNEAEAVALEIGSKALLTSVRLTAAWSVFARGRLPEALELNARALESLPEDDAPLLAAPGTSSRAALLSMRAGILSFMGRREEAETLCQEVLTLGEDEERSEWVAVTRGMLARWESECGRADSALQHAMRAVMISEASDNNNALIQSLRTLSCVHSARGEWSPAIDVAERCLGVVRDSGILSAEVDVLCSLSAAHLGARNLGRALELAAEAVRLAPERDLLQEVASQLQLARCLRGLSGGAEADAIEEALARATELVDETGAVYFEAPIHEQAAELALLRGQPDVAQREFERARKAFAVRGATREAELVAERAAQSSS